MEHCCNRSKGVFDGLEWVERGRSFRMDYRSSGAGRFIQVSAVAVEGKRFNLIFLEGKGFVRGWFVIASKLRALGVRLQRKSKDIETKVTSIITRKDVVNNEISSRSRKGRE